ncbi:MAG: TonB-dependent receptor [Polyangiaceae bacterium]
MRAFRGLGIVVTTLGLFGPTRAWGQEAGPGPSERPVAPKDQELGDGETARAIADPAPPPPPERVAAVAHGPDASPEGADDPTFVRVRSTKATQTSGSVYSVGEKQLQRFKYDDPHALFLSVPGIYARGEDGLGLRPNLAMRGGNSDRSKKLTLMEDGVLFGPAPYSAPAAYYFPMIARMQNVVVTKGPASIVHGPQTVGGAIDLVTRSIPESSRVTGDLALGQYGYDKVHATYGGSNERGGFLLEGMHLGSTGFKDLDGGGDTGFSRSEWMAKGRYVLDPSAKVEQELSIKLGYSTERSNETYLGLTDEDFRKTPYRRYAASRLDQMNLHRTQIVLTHRATFSRDFEIVTTAYRNDLQRTWYRAKSFRGEAFSNVLAAPHTAENQPLYDTLTGSRNTPSDAATLLAGPNDRTFVSQGIQTAVRYNPKTGPVTHKIEYGLRAHYDEIVRIHSSDPYVVDAGRLVRAPELSTTEANNKVGTMAFAMYAMDAVTIHRLTVTPGIRVENIHGRYTDKLTNAESGGVQNVVIPGVGAYYAFTKEFGALAGVHKGFSPAVADSGNVKPEESVNYEAGARYASRHLRADLIGFLNEYSNLTDICTLSGGCTEGQLDKQFDAGRARVYGLEAYVDTEFKVTPTLSIPARAAYTLTFTRFLNTFTSADPQFGFVQIGDELPYVPRNQLSATTGLEGKRWGITAQGTFVDRMRERAGAGPYVPTDTTDAYFLLDVSGQVTVWRTVNLYVNVRNLLDETYLASRRPFGARPGAPRWVQVGAKFEF